MWSIIKWFDICIMGDPDGKEEWNGKETDVHEVMTEFFWIWIKT